MTYPIKNPRRIGPHVASLIDDLRAGGAEDITVTKPRHVHVEFRLGDERFHIVTASTPRCVEMAITCQRQELRRIFQSRLEKRRA